MAEFKVHAPYNFVPFSNQVLLRYARPEELPPHNVIDPALKTGEIHITMAADTPCFVSDGDKNTPHFFRTPDGHYALPGTTIRGMIRENIQILGFGAVCPGEEMKDYQIYFREIAAAKGSVGGPLKNYYQTVLGIDPKDPKAPPQNVRAGYLRKRNGQYVIQPVKGCYLRVSRQHPDVARLDDTPAKSVSIAYVEAGGCVKEFCARAHAKPGMSYGMLLYTGRWVGKFPNHLYVFPEADESAASLPLEPVDILSYREDWENRKNTLKAYYDPDFWALPEDGDEKPVFYIRHNGHIYFGMSLFLRIGYLHSLSMGLPPKHRSLTEEGNVPLDYPRAMLGYARDTESYRSRVSFGDLIAQGRPQELEQVDAILGQPKPSWYPGYVIDGKNYTEEAFRLRGYKQYWLKAPNVPKPEKVNVASHMRPLAPGTVFRGVIRYKNLHEDELGLLLWALRLEDGCYQSVGMGKPYGYGRMKLTIDALREFDVQALYTGLDSGGKTNGKDTVEQYIAAYDAFASDCLSRHRKKKCLSLRERSEIKDFFFLHRAIQEGEGSGYMELGAYKNIHTPLPDVKSMREEQERQEEKPLTLADLQAHFNAMKN